MRIDGRVAVVTGAASGIGRALAVELARRGADVAVTDVDADRLAPVADEVRAVGRKVSVHGFDVADRAAWPPFVDALLGAHGRVHLVVNNAGVALNGPFVGCSLEDLDWQLGVNLWGVIHGCHFLLPVLLRQDAGHLVNVSSLFGILSVPDNAAYCMSKHAVRALTESLEQELWDTRVRLTSVHPGAVATRIAVDGRYRDGGYVDPDRARAVIAGGIPPEAAARTIADGIEQDARRILVGSDARVLAWLPRLFPVRYRDLQMRWLRWQRRR